MVRTLWFIIKLSILIGVAVWVADHPGTFTVQWLDYTITAHIGAALVALLVVIMISSYAGRVFAYLKNLPDTIDRYRHIKGTKKALARLTKGYAELAAGDLSSADKSAGKADKMLPGSYSRGLVWSLKAQIAKQTGDHHTRRQYLARLAEDKDTAVLGLRGILQDTLEHGDYNRAQEFIDTHMAAYSTRPWMMRFRYFLALQKDDWSGAQDLLEHRAMRKAFSKDRIKSDHIALLVHRADQDLANNIPHEAVAKLKKVLRLDKSFIPAATRLAAIYLDMGKKSAARAILKKAWVRRPHPDIVPLWSRVYDQRTRKNTKARIKHFQNLVQYNPNSAVGHRALASVALEEKDWATARSALEKAGEIEQTSDLYYLWAEFEERVNGDRLAVETYLRKAATAKPDKRWICTKTGHVYGRWSAIAEPHGRFNTIRWRRPDDHDSQKRDTLEIQEIADRTLEKTLPEKAGADAAPLIHEKE